jgi:hypothetical protein
MPLSNQYLYKNTTAHIPDRTIAAPMIFLRLDAGLNGIIPTRSRGWQ